MADRPVLPPPTGPTPFLDHLRGRIEGGGLALEEALALVVPLVRQAVKAHQADKVAPLDGVQALLVTGGVGWYREADEAAPVTGRIKLAVLDPPERRAFEVVGEVRRTADLDGDGDSRADLRVAKAGDDVTKPVYLPGYRAWEHAAGHHDAHTDTFSLGMLLASAACGLDFTEPAQLARFVAARGDLFTLRPGLHPVVAKAIVRMTEASRHRRAQDLPAVLARLEGYRDPALERATDPGALAEAAPDRPQGRRGQILGRLRERLFEISRRNRLLFFRPSMQSVNLTWGSVPLTVDPAAVRADGLFTWQGEIARQLSAGTPIALEKHLRFEDAPYLKEVLDRILAEAKRDAAEYGFAQLRLVLCFLRWHDLKEAKHERIDSPLLLLPVRLARKKGVRDSYLLEPLGTEAEVNPVLRHHLRRLYAIDLPTSVDLQETTLAELHQLLSARIVASEPGVTLNLVDRPRVELVYDRAKRRLDQYRRRQRLAGRGIKSWNEVDYSYARENFQPLGLRLFQLKVRPAPAPLRGLLKERPTPRSMAVPEGEPVAERERTLVEFQVDGGATNPYSWDFDLCSLTLGNFKYRKMSLVRDYEALLGAELPSPPFEAVFAAGARPPGGTAPPVPPLGEQLPVVAADPTQTSAVALARTGASFVIQGPPGTGKSQTITNLIADYVARGKRVLFVCEKRAALDVVFHRLQQAGLGALCSLIHDSQQDKKEFILDLKATYEAFLKRAGDGEDPDARRRRVVAALEAELEPLREFDARMRSDPAEAGLPLLELLQRRLELEGRVPELGAAALERFPPYRHWHEHRPALERLGAALRDLGTDGVLGRHPLARLAPGLGAEERPIEALERRVREARQALDAVQGSPLLAGEASLELARRRADEARRLAPLARRDLLGLLEPGSVPSRELLAKLEAQRGRAAALESALAETRGWKRKLPPDEARDALELARGLEGALLGFLRPSWWKLRGVLQDGYDFASHALAPSWSRILERLVREYEVRAELARGEARLREEYGFEGESAAFAAGLRQLAATAAAGPGGRLPARDEVLARAEAEAGLGRLEAGLAALLDGGHPGAPAALEAELARIEGRLEAFHPWLPCLAELGRLPAGLRRAVRDEGLALDAVEGAMAERSARAALRGDRFLAGFSGPVRDRHVERLEQQYRAWLEVNAAAVEARVRRLFLDHVALSLASVAGQPPERKAFKARYAAGRRDLEHEFEKTMRYKSVRGLLAEESGDVILDLKPIWLMSPLSVSDTLPLDVSRFDVVVFDEASQIPLEDAIPSVHRADQIIVVGDEMQLPPTSFFASRAGDDEDQPPVGEGLEPLDYDLEGDSFLNHACRKLPATMLGWHYRSRSEALIGFSNAAFYQGELLTVPERRAVAALARGPARLGPGDGGQQVERLFGTSLSFHRLEGSPYRDRRNPCEAAYIAELVRGLLARGAGPSLGIIAFSEAQQDEIDRALAALAKADPEFAARLEVEEDRQEDGQFAGLLVKNLENIQGDERDVVILSVCYGPGPDGRMLMNFGPINQGGGEKRLNVAFSRARRHMAVVSSIDAEAISNDWNDGARCLKSYLRYAEAVSRGDLGTAGRVLDEEVGRRAVAAPAAGPAQDAVGAQLAAVLRARGYLVEAGVGQSRFRCDLAVRRPGDAFHRMAVLIDTPGHYRSRDLLERELLRPRVLRAFDWSVSHVLVRDWYLDRAGVLGRLVEALERGAPPPPA